MLYDDLKLLESSDQLPPTAGVWVDRSWLFCEEGGEGWRAGCIACAQAQQGMARKHASPYSIHSVVLHNKMFYKLAKHHDSFTHKQNVVKFLGLELGSSGIALDIAPSTEHFKEA